MDKTSTFIRSLSVFHAPTYYDQISDYKFLYVKNGAYFVVKYNYYNGFASFATLIVPFSKDDDDILLYEKDNQGSYTNKVIVQDDYKSVLAALSAEDHKEIESRMTDSQRDEATIVSLLKAYELTGRSLI